MSVPIANIMEPADWQDREMERLEAENAKLREQLADERAEVEWTHDFLALMAERIRGDADAHNLVDYVRKLEAENDKLRELVRDYERCTMHADCDKCEYDGKTSTHCPMSPCFPDSDELRELGIEVDG